MGSDQSSQKGSGKSRGKNQPKRSQSAGSDDGGGNSRGDKLFGNTSPRPSICSDSEIPYISYATTRPICDDPPERKSKWGESKARAREKHINREKRDNKAKSIGSIVTVKAASEPPTIEKDLLYKRLIEIPSFVPIIRGSLKIPWTKDPDMSDKIEHHPLTQMAHLYEEWVKRRTRVVCQNQTRLAQKIDLVEETIECVANTLTERQRSLTTLIECLDEIKDMSLGLSDCHRVLNQSLESIELLNNMLPLENRVEPFIWTTG